MFVTTVFLPPKPSLIENEIKCNEMLHRKLHEEQLKRKDEVCHLCYALKCPIILIYYSNSS